MNLDTQVKLHFHELTPNDYDIWQYICDHREECRNGTISQLATACHVSSAAITRFTKKVGLSSCWNCRSCALKSRQGLRVRKWIPNTQPSGQHLHRVRQLRHTH